MLVPVQRPSFLRLHVRPSGTCVGAEAAPAVLAEMTPEVGAFASREAFADEE